MIHRTLFQLFSGTTENGQELFAPETVATLKSKPEWARLEGEIASAAPGDVALAALRALSLERDASRANSVDIQFVATLPGFTSNIAVTTEQAIEALLGNAKHQIVAVGYEISSGRFVEQLHAFAGRGGQVSLVTDRRSGHGARILARWPSYGTPPRVFQERKSLISDKSKMHGKALLVDGERLFISSANFTWLGMNANIELGVIVSGARVRPARDLFDELLNRSGLLERVEG